MHCGWLRCHVVCFEMVVWGELEDDRVIRTTQIYSVLHSTTKYYSGTTLYDTVLLQYYAVLQSTTPVLFCTTKYYSSTTLYYKVLLQYHCTTTYYSSTSLYCKILLQYYPCTTKYYSSTALYYKSTTPVLVCTTRYYSSTTLYYTELPTDLHQYNNSVLQSTTPVLLCTTKYYSLYYKVRICKARSTNVTKCCACHAK